jgi:signal transduction histidine kinase
MAHVDEVHFTNVIFNLLDNALKYRRGTPVFHIKTWNRASGLGNQRARQWSWHFQGQSETHIREILPRTHR